MYVWSVHSGYGVPPSKGGGGATQTWTGPSASTMADILRLQQEIDALCAEMDQFGVNAARLAQLRALQAQLAAAINSGSPQDQAFNQMLALLQAQLDNDNENPQLQNDQAALQSTQDQINALLQDMDTHGVNGAKLAELRALQAQLAQEQEAVDKDKAPADADQMIISDALVQADQGPIDSAYANLLPFLTQYGIDLNNGDVITKDDFDKLANDQNATAAANAYMDALVNQQRDFWNWKAAFAELQKLASNPDTAGAAKDAIDAVNKIRESQGLPDIPYVNALDDPNQARKNADDAEKAAQYWSALSNVFDAQVAADAAHAKLDLDYAQWEALRQKYRHIVPDFSEYASEDPAITADQAAAAQADSDLKAAQDNFAKLRQQLEDQASPELKKELGIDIAQQYLSDAEANLTAAQADLKAAQAMPPGKARQLALAAAEDELAQAQAQLDDAQAQLAQAQEGNWNLVTLYSEQDWENALKQLHAKHDGEIIFDIPVSDIIDQYGWEFKLNQEMALIQSGQVPLTAQEQSLLHPKNPGDPQISLPTLAALKLAGVSINDKITMEIAQVDPWALVYMQLGHVTIKLESGVWYIKGITDNKDKLKLDPALAQACVNPDISALIQVLMGNDPKGNPYITLDQNSKTLIDNLMLGTQAARLDYVKAQMSQLMTGPNASAQNAKDAMKLLLVNMMDAFTPEEVTQLWEEAGAPYFTKEALERIFKTIAGGNDLDKTGEFVKELLADSNGYYKVAEVIVSAMEDAYGITSIQIAQATSGSKGAEFFEALSMAVQDASADPDGGANVVSNCAQYLTAKDEHGTSIIQLLDGMDGFAVHNAIMNGYGLLSDAVEAILKNDNSYFAQRFNTDYQYAQQDLKNAQAYAASQPQSPTFTNGTTNFDPKTDVTAYFNQFKDNNRFNHPIQVSNDTELEDIIGQALGLTATDAQAEINQDYTKDWYAKGSYQRAIIDLIIKWIHKEGGAAPTITVLPMIYAPGDGSAQYGALFEVSNGHGHSAIIDGLAAEQDVNINDPLHPSDSQQAIYHDVKDFQENDPYSMDGTIYLPQNGVLIGDTTGTTPPDHTNGPGYIQYQARTWGWKDTVNVVIDVAAVTVAIGVTVITGGWGGVLLGGALGLVAFEVGDGIENAITLNQGDKLNNQRISLFTTLSDNWWHHDVTGQEWAQAGVDAAKDAINSYAAAAGTYFGAAETEASTEAIGTGAMKPWLVRVFGVRPWVIRAAAGGRGMFVTQAWMGAGNIISTGVDAGYLVSQGKITQDQAADMVASAFGSALFNLATAPIAGGVGGLLPAGVPGKITASDVLGQFGVNLAINTTLTEGNEAISGGWDGIKKNFGRDALSIWTNTLAGMAMHLYGAISTRAKIFSAIKSARNSGSVTGDLTTIAFPGESWDGKSSAVYVKQKGEYGVAPLVPLTTKGGDTVPALFLGQGAPPSELNEARPFIKVYRASPDKPLLGFNKKEYIVTFDLFAMGKQDGKNAIVPLVPLKTIDGDTVPALFLGFGAPPSQLDETSPLIKVRRASPDNPQLGFTNGEYAVIPAMSGLTPEDVSPASEADMYARIFAAQEEFWQQLRRPGGRSYNGLPEAGTTFTRPAGGEGPGQGSGAAPLDVPNSQYAGTFAVTPDGGGPGPGKAPRTPNGNQLAPIQAFARPFGLVDPADFGAVSRVSLSRAPFLPGIEAFELPGKLSDDAMRALDDKYPGILQYHLPGNGPDGSDKFYIIPPDVYGTVHHPDELPQPDVFDPSPRPLNEAELARLKKDFGEKAEGVVYWGTASRTYDAIQLSEPPTDDEMLKLQKRWGTEFGLIYQVGKRKGGGGGKHFLIQGREGVVDMPLQCSNVVFLKHTHPQMLLGERASPVPTLLAASAADSSALQDLSSITPQRKSEILPEGQLPFQFGGGYTGPFKVNRDGTVTLTFNGKEVTAKVIAQSNGVLRMPEIGAQIQMPDEPWLGQYFRLWRNPKTGEYRVYPQSDPLRSLIVPAGGNIGTVNAYFPPELGGALPPLWDIRLPEEANVLVTPPGETDPRPKQYRLALDPQNGQWVIRLNNLNTPRSANADRFVNYTPGAPTVDAIIDGYGVTVQVPSEGPQPQSSDDFAVQGEPLDGKHFVIYRRGNGSFAVSPIVELTVNGVTVSAVWMGQGAPPPADKLQADYEAGFLNVYTASPEQRARGFTNGEYVILPAMAGGAQRPGEDPGTPDPAIPSGQQPGGQPGTIELKVPGETQPVTVTVPGTGPISDLSDIWIPGGTDMGQPWIVYHDGSQYVIRLRSDPDSRQMLLMVNGKLETATVEGTGPMPAPSDIQELGTPHARQSYVLVDAGGQYIVKSIRAAIKERADQLYLQHQNPQVNLFQARLEIKAQLGKGPLAPGNLQDMIKKRADQLYQQHLDPQFNLSQAEQDVIAEIETGRFQQPPGNPPPPSGRAAPGGPEDWYNWVVNGKRPRGKPFLQGLHRFIFRGKNPPGPSYRPEDYDALIYTMLDRGELQLNGNIAIGRNGGEYPLTYTAFRADNQTILLAWLPEFPGDTDIHFHTYTFAQTFSTKGHPGAVDDLLRRGNWGWARIGKAGGKGDLGGWIEKALGKGEVTNYGANVAKMVRPGSEVSLGPVPYYCGVFQGHYTNHEILTILMTNLRQLDVRTATDLQNLPYEPMDAANGDTRNKFAQYGNDPSDTLPWPKDGNRFVQDPNNPVNTTLPANLRWKDLHELELRVRVHGTSTALDFSGTGPNAAAAFEALLKEYPLIFAHFGEITFNKEHVQVQRGPVDMENFREFLIWLKQQGLGKIFVVIHNDWSRVGEDPAGRPLTVMGAYENLVEAVRFWTDPSLREVLYEDPVTGEKTYGNLMVQPVFAHSGIGRTSRASDVQTPELTFEYYDKHGVLQTEQRGFSDHIDVMRYLKEKIPNLVFDFSWNDVTMNYIQSPMLRARFIEWVLEENPNLPKEQWNRFSIFIGSDSVRPVLLYQKNQGINTFLPILADLARLGPDGEEAVLNLVVRNYARLMDEAYKAQIDWWDKNKNNEGFDAQKYEAAKAEFDLLQTIRNGLRDDQGNLVLGPDGKPVFIGSRAYLEQKIQLWMMEVQDKGEVDPAELDSPGAFVSITRDNPHPVIRHEPPRPFDMPVRPAWKSANLPGKLQYPLAVVGWGLDTAVTSWRNGWVRRGDLTAGGARNNPAVVQDPRTQRFVRNPDPVTQNAVGSLRTSVFALTAAALGLGALDTAAAAFGGPFGTFITRILSEGSFVGRVGAFVARDTWNENVRLFREQLTEEGYLTREALNEFVSPITRSAGEKDFSVEQLKNVHAATEQFWNNYKKIKEEMPVDTGPDAARNNGARAQAILEEVGRLTSKLASILNVDPASLSPFSSTAPWGIALRAAVLVTYIFNVGASLPNLVVPAMHGDILSLITSVAIDATNFGFVATNAFAGTLTLEGLAGGITRRNLEGHPWLQQLQRIAQWGYVVDGGIWTSSQTLQTLTDIFINHGPITSALDLVELTGILTWWYAANRNRVAVEAGVTGRAQPHTYEQWKTFVIMFAGLAVAIALKEILKDAADPLKAADRAVDSGVSNLFNLLFGGSNQKPEVTPTPTQTPTPVPTQPPVTTPLPRTSFPTSPQTHFPGNPNPAGYDADANANGANYVKVTPGESLWRIAANVVLDRNQIENLHPTSDQLNAQIWQELRLIEQANPQIVQNGGSGTYDLIWAGDEIDVPNLAQIPGIAPQAGAIPGWAINGNVPGTVLPSGLTLNPGDRYTSPSGQYELVMQLDGDLVLYRNNSNGTQTQIFDTGTYENNPYGLGVGDHAVIQSDGNLVVYKANNDGDKPGDIVWQSDTGSAADAYSVLAIQDDGNLVIYAKGGATWDAKDDSINGRLVGDTDPVVHPPRYG